MVRLKLAVIVGFVCLFALPKASEAQGTTCRGSCTWYFDEFNDAYHANPLVPTWAADSRCDGDGCHSDYYPGTCDDFHTICSPGTLSSSSKEALTSNNVEQIKKLMKDKNSVLKFSKDGKSIQLLGCNGQVVMQKPLTKEMQVALKS